MESGGFFKPKVSIIIPVYNGSNYLAEAIDSVLAQTYSNIEVIVINDGSNDGGKTQAIINSYGTRIRSYVKENGGVASALNLGIDMMQGEYFSWLSHDDKYLPNKITSQIDKIWEVGNKQAIIYSGYRVVNERGRIVDEFRPDKIYNLTRYTHPLFPVLRLMVNGCTLLFHKDHFNRVGGFNINLKTTQDYDMWYKLFRNQIVIYSPKIEVIHRHHKGQDSIKNVAAHIKECDELWNRMLQELSPIELAHIDDNAYIFFKRTYDILKSRTLYHEAIRYAERRALQELRSLLLKGNKYHQIVDRSMDLLSESIYLRNIVNQYQVICKNKPRVAFFMSDKEEKGGLPKVINMVVQQLAEYYEVIVIYSSMRFDKGYEKNGNIIRIGIRTNRDWQANLAKLLVLLGIDVFIGCHNCLMHFIDMYTLFKSYGIKCVAWNHEDYLFTEVNKVYQKVGINRKVVFHNLDAVVWINKLSKMIYDKEANNGVYIPDGTISSENVNLQLPKEDFSLIAVGRYYDQIKRLDRLLEVFAILQERNPKVKLYIVGDCNIDMKLSVLNNETIRERINKFGIDPQKIIFTNWIPDVSSYYQKATIQLSTSESEGFGLVILEAARYDTPTIAFSNGGAESIITNGENGYIVESISDMVEKVELLFKDQRKYNLMKNKCKLLSKNYDINLIIDKWRRLLNGIIYNDESLLANLISDPEIANESEQINRDIQNRYRQLNYQN